jgi:hypothetical protein
MGDHFGGEADTGFRVHVPRGFRTGFDELYDSMKSDIGLCFRVMSSNDVGRLDLVRSEDDAAAWLIYGHPF